MDKYVLTPKQAMVLSLIRDQDEPTALLQLSVLTRLLPNEVKEILAGLEGMDLIRVADVPKQGPTARLTKEGRGVGAVLAKDWLPAATRGAVGAAASSFLLGGPVGALIGGVVGHWLGTAVGAKMPQTTSVVVLSED